MTANLPKLTLKDVTADFLCKFKGVPLLFFISVGFLCGFVEFCILAINKTGYLNNNFPTSWLTNIIFDHIPTTSIVSLSAVVMLANLLAPISKKQIILKFIVDKNEKLINILVVFSSTSISILTGYFIFYSLQGAFDAVGLAILLLIISFTFLPYGLFIMHQTLRGEFSKKQRTTSGLLALGFVVFIFLTPYISPSPDSNIIKLDSETLKYLEKIEPNLSPNESIKKIIKEYTKNGEDYKSLTK